MDNFQILLYNKILFDKVNLNKCAELVYLQLVKIILQKT